MSGFAKARRPTEGKEEGTEGIAAWPPVHGEQHDGRI